MSPKDVIKIHSRFVAEINMKIEFMKMNYESEYKMFSKFRKTKFTKKGGKSGKCSASDRNKTMRLAPSIGT